ncbi:DUF4232 domain-containing protein [Kutzneria sp. CA-103260]|uniref:DUF4232 domain-containing protein n=1 Tax=Kutzneria sp. CA-103260 TaxID=2802641 RepID=UPI001BA54469|nr:DUF4232 domain-containing protein [Kutzneria sp. CA-103260]QUQ69404.1 hypothetical protein JJ691_71620 [Kutzneria sp. CA-103260]
MFINRVLVATGVLAAAATVLAPIASAQPATIRCDNTTLAAALASPDAGAGQRYIQFVVTNTSQATCTLYGHGGFALVGAPTQLTWTANPGPSLITLTPGQQAAMTLHWTAVPADDEPGAQCEPVAATAISIPPDETQPLTVAWTGGPVCQHGRMDASAYYKL